MFSISNIHKNGFSITVLKDSNSGTSVEIIPSCGGILHGFTLSHNGNFLNVIDHYNNKKDFDENVTAKGFKSCKLSPFACRIKNGVYSFDKKSYQVKKFMLGENAIHGLIYNANFSVVQQFAGEENATVVLQHEYKGADPGYPFHFDCIITYQLVKNNELLISTEIINRDKEPIPLQDGWHPYFTLGKKIDELELQLNSQQQIIFNDKMIPTGELIPYSQFAESKKLGDVSFDDCFKLNMDTTTPACILKDPGNDIQVEIRPGKSYPWLQLYTPPHRKSIAIENLSAPPDTFNNGIHLIILPPEEYIIFNTSYKVTSV
jgi:aldose 1-epimerase